MFGRFNTLSAYTAQSISHRPVSAPIVNAKNLFVQCGFGDP
jgi:hypothetical protein